MSLKYSLPCLNRTGTGVSPCPPARAVEPRNLAARPSRLAMAHVLPSRKGTLSASVIFHLSRLIPAPRMTPVYASNPASPRRPQNSVPACPLRLWPDETFTHRLSSAFHDALPKRGVAERLATTISDMGRIGQITMAGNPTTGSSLNAGDGFQRHVASSAGRPIRRSAPEGSRRRA